MLYKESEMDGSAPLLVVIITLMGGFLRIYLLDGKGLWLDETFSVWMANHTAADMLQWITRVDQHPPLYYLLLHFWVSLNGDSPYMVRLLSALIGTLTIPVMYLIGKRIAGTVMGLAAALFMSLSLFNIYFAQEARMYTLLTFNAAVAIYALVRLLTDPRSVKPIGSQFREYLHAWRTLGPVENHTDIYFRYRVDPHNQKGLRGWIARHRWLPIQAVETDLAWIVLIIFSAATLLSHNTAVFFFFAINLYVLGLLLYQRMARSKPLPAFQAPSLGNWVKAKIAIFLLWSPWAVSFFRQASVVDRQFWIPQPTWESVIHTLRSLLNPSAPDQTGLIMTWLLCGVICLGGIFLRKHLSIFLFLAVLFAVPFLGELAVSIRRPIFFDRTLIWITIPLFLALAAGIAQLRFQMLIIVTLGVFGAYFVFSTSDYYRFVQKEDWDDPAGYVALRMKKDDVILFNSAMVQIAFDYYFEDYENKKYFQVEERGVPDMFETRVPEPRMQDSDIPRLISLLDGHDRVWLVYSHELYSDPMGLIPKTLAEEMKLVEKHEFYGGQVHLYEAPSP